MIMSCKECFTKALDKHEEAVNLVKRSDSISPWIQEMDAWLADFMKYHDEVMAAHQGALESPQARDQ